MLRHTGNGIGDTFGALATTFTWNAGRDLNVVFDALETKGLVKTLAEPSGPRHSGGLSVT